MSARVKVDEDLPRQIADLLAAHGHDAATVVGQGWQGVSDDVLWLSLQNERRWLITADKGFADLAPKSARKSRGRDSAAVTRREPKGALGNCHHCA